MDTIAIEDFIRAKVRRKLHKIEAEAMAKDTHREELKSWAKIADAAVYRLKTYEQKRDWIKLVTAAGICSHEEAVSLARIKFKL